METPASLYAVRVPSDERSDRKKAVPAKPRTPSPHDGTRRLSATELALAALIYSHARADHDVPVCTRPKAWVAAALGKTAKQIQLASKVLEAAGYVRRSHVSGVMWRWEILIHPNTCGHRWADAAPCPSGVECDPGPCDQHGVGSDPRGLDVTQDQGLDPTHDAGVGCGPRGSDATPHPGLDPTHQHQELIREEASAASGQAQSTPTAEWRARRADALARDAAISARAEQAEAASRRWPKPPMSAGVSATDEHDQIRQRFAAVLDRWPTGSPERTRLAACRLATPIASVLERASEDMGGLPALLDALEWAWGEVALGRSTAFGKADATTAMRDAFRGEGRYWRGILDAYGRRPGEQRTIAYEPPDFTHVVPVSSEEMDAMTWGNR
jgi:hypothetical protein